MSERYYPVHAELTPEQDDRRILVNEQRLLVAEVERVHGLLAASQQDCRRAEAQLDDYRAGLEACRERVTPPAECAFCAPDVCASCMERARISGALAAVFRSLL